MELKAQNIIQVQGRSALRTVWRTPPAFSPNIKLNMDPPVSVAVSRLASLFYTFMSPSAVPSYRWASYLGVKHHR